MEQPSDIIQPAKHSPILAFALARPKIPWPWLAIVFGVMTFVGLTAMLWLSFSQPLHISERTAVLIATRPRTIDQLLASGQRQQLPLIWQEALQTRSYWPVILGADRRADGWHYLAIIPRWQAGKFKTHIRESRGLISVLSDAAIPASQHQFHYTEQLAWWQHHFFAPFCLWADPRLAFLHSDSAQDSGWLLAPFTAVYQSHGLLTTIPFSGKEKPLPVKQADISITIPADQGNQNFRAIDFERLTAGNLPLAQLPEEPLQINLNLDQSFSPVKTSFVFNQPIQSALAKLLFAGVGLTKTRLNQLPDGTVIREQVWLGDNGQDWFLGKKDAGRFGSVQIDGAEFRFGSSSDAFPNPNHDCAAGDVWAQLSGRLVLSLFQQIGDLKTLSPLPDVQLISNHGKLIICHL